MTNSKFIYHNAIHISYMHQPFRLLWYNETYSKGYSNWYKLLLLAPFLGLLRKMDYKAARKIDFVIANNVTTKQRILDCYSMASEVINPPTVLENRSLKNNFYKKDYFLVVSRLEPYKRVDLVIKAFNKLKLQLIVIGSGSMLFPLKKIANENIELLSNVDEDTLIKYYNNCHALILPQEEDYGLTPLEANSFGKPVICYGKGGVRTTMIPYTGDNINNATAIFFHEQTVVSIIKSVKTYMKIKFNPKAIMDNVSRFDKPTFENKINKIISTFDSNNKSL